MGLLVFRYPFKSENLEILMPSISFIISPIFIPAVLAPDSLSIPFIKNPSVSSTFNSFALKLFNEVPVTPRNPYCTFPYSKISSITFFAILLGTANE